MGEELRINAQMRGYVDIVTYGDSEIDSEMVISQRGGEDIDIELLIQPSGYMRGYVDIVEPVKRILKIYPTKDSTVRESAPIINYGKSGQMMAGRENKGKFISYLGFTLEWPEEVDELLSAKLVLNKEYLTDKLFFMGIHEVSDNWLEDYITWNYRPIDEQYLTQFVIPTGVGRVESDLTEYVRNWSTEGGSKSFTLHPRNYDFSDLTTFSTRESTNSPYIEITYYEKPKNANTTNLEGEMEVVIRANRDLTTTLEVSSDSIYSELDSEITLRKKEESANIPTYIEVANHGGSELGIDVELIKKDIENSIDNTLIVPYTSYIDLAIELQSKPDGGELDSEVIVKAFNEQDLDTEFNIENKYIDEELEVDITVKKDTFTDLTTEFAIENKPVGEDLDIEFTIKSGGSVGLDTEFTIEIKPIEDELYTEFIVKKIDSVDLDADFVIEKKELYSELDLDMHIKSFGNSDILTEIEVPKIDVTEEIGFEMIIPYISEIEGEIELQGKFVQSDIPMAIITVPKEKEDIIEADMIVRAFWAEELECSLIIERNFEINMEMEVISTTGGDYAFII